MSPLSWVLTKSATRSKAPRRDALVMASAETPAFPVRIRTTELPRENRSDPLSSAAFGALTASLVMSRMCRPVTEIVGRSWLPEPLLSVWGPAPEAGNSLEQKLSASSQSSTTSWRLRSLPVCVRTVERWPLAFLSLPHDGARVFGGSLVGVFIDPRTKDGVFPTA